MRKQNSGHWQEVRKAHRPLTLLHYSASSSQEMVEGALSSPLNSNCTPPASADSYMLRSHAKQVTQALSELPGLFGNHPT